MNLTHINEHGEVHMVDVTQKDVTIRQAQAQAIVTMRPETRQMILHDQMKKGDVLACARIAGVMAAKRTAELIPMCHAIPIDSVSVDITPIHEMQLRIVATAQCTWKTGIEMEALTAASVAALTIYDMCKAVDRSMELGGIMLLRKSGGKSGDFIRQQSE